jgi:hypothetical protein
MTTGSTDFSAFESAGTGLPCATGFKTATTEEFSADVNARQIQLALKYMF